MKKTIRLWMGCVLALVPALAEAAPAGLEYLKITASSAPENPKSVIKLLEKMPGFGDAQWDAKAGLFTVMAEDSAHFAPRALVDALRVEGVEVTRLSMHFEEVHAKTENGAGIIYSPPNRLSFPAVFTWGGQRFWGFWGNNPRGQGAAFRMDLDVRLGALGADGKAAPDSVEIVRFELTKPYYKGQEN
jgi:hypothetical protein